MIDFNAHYKVTSWNLGVAVYPVEYKKEMVGTWDEDGGIEWFDEETDESQVYVIMVGDDERHLVDVDDLELIKETDFCRECGQIGCGCVVYE